MALRALPAVLAVVLLTLAPGPAGAAKPGSGGASSIHIDQADPQRGDVVTFTTTHPTIRSAPRVRVLCSQNGTQVYQYASDADALYHLWSVSWAEGIAADCFADLYYFTYKGQTQTGVVYLAHTEFAVRG